MKANEIPEKIYIDDFGSELGCDWHTEHSYENDIEYTRTDAFIAKAWEWFECNLSDRTKEDIEVWIEDFVNYIKG